MVVPYVLDQWTSEIKLDLGNIYWRTSDIKTVPPNASATVPSKVHTLKLTQQPRHPFLLVRCVLSVRTHTLSSQQYSIFSSLSCIPEAISPPATAGSRCHRPSPFWRSLVPEATTPLLSGDAALWLVAVRQRNPAFSQGILHL